MERCQLGFISFSSSVPMMKGSLIGGRRTRTHTRGRCAYLKVNTQVSFREGQGREEEEEKRARERERCTPKLSGEHGSVMEPVCAARDPGSGP